MEELQDLAELIRSLDDELKLIKTKEELNLLRARFMGKSSRFSEIQNRIKDIPPEKRAEFGKAIYEYRNQMNDRFDNVIKILEERAIAKRIENETIDITLKGDFPTVGAKNPFYKVIDEMTDIFVSMGFSVEEGSDVETDHFNFELLNVPKDHPARDMQDTFYIDETFLLRTQTSASQAHVLQRNSNVGIKIISPGKCYRRDNDDATHSHQFAQVEGLVVDKGITMANLKGTLEMFCKKMFGEKREIRLRSSYFPFTEPSVEVDVSCSECGGKGCSMCKGTGYIEILGAGMVHPNVLRMSGYDPEIYSGFAFGIGVDRVAMLRYGIDDIRKIYSNDIRFLNQFKKRK